MSGYIERYLAPGEQIRSRAKLHWILWVRAWGALLLLGIFVVGIVIFVHQAITMNTTELAATDRRLILKRGLFQRQVMDIGLNNIEAVRISQGYLGRLLDFGRLTIHGTGDDAWSTPLIADPSGFRRDIEAATPVLSRPAQP